MVMFKRFAASLVLVVALAGAGPVLADELKPHQIRELAATGHVDQALQAMNEVLKNHPGNAEAHFIEAELQARVGDFQRAREELATSQRLDPGSSFEKNPNAVAELERQIARGNNVRSAPPGYTHPVPVQEHRSGSMWPVFVLIIAGIVIAWALLSRRRMPPTYYPPAGGPVGGGYGPGPMGGGYGPAGYGPPMGGGGMGSGIVGGLATGLAVGAGVAAGEELVHHMIDGNGNRVPVPPDYTPPPDDNNADMGGNDFGVKDGDSWGSDSGGSFGGDSGGGGGDDSWT
jgi:hypothetical protein